MVLEEYVPAGQGTATAGSGQYEPAGHEEHTTDPAGANVPTGQLVHAAEDVEYVKGDEVPAGHGHFTPSVQKYPDGHTAHAERSSVAYRPAMLH